MITQRQAGLQGRSQAGLSSATHIEREGEGLREANLAQQD